MFIKGFDEDLKCRGVQFEVGKEYKIKNSKAPTLCTDSVFHYCETLQQVHAHYSASPLENNRFCEIIPLSKEVFDGSKRGAKKIKIIREILGEELVILRGLINGNTGIFNSGNRNSGNWNSGNWNSGNRNSGNENSGNENSGNRNSGDWNSGDENRGYFNSLIPDMLVFNKPCKREVWERAKKPGFLFFDLVTWVSFNLMTDTEKRGNPRAEVRGGCFKTLSYKEAFQKSYNDLSNAEREKQTALLKALPNFDADIFFEISGIRIK